MDTDHGPEFGSGNELLSVAEVIGEATAGF